MAKTSTIETNIEPDFKIYLKKPDIEELCKFIQAECSH